MENINTTNPIFSYQKLDWFNGHYLRQTNDEKLAALIKPFAPEEMTETLLKKTIPLVKDRLVKLSDYPVLTDFFVKDPQVDTDLLLKKGGNNEELIKGEFKETVSVLTKLTDWKKEAIEKNLRELAEKNNWHIGKYFMAIRIALTGKTATPPLFELMEVLGKEESLSRLKCIYG